MNKDEKMVYNLTGQFGFEPWKAIWHQSITLHNP